MTWLKDFFFESPDKYDTMQITIDYIGTVLGISFVLDYGIYTVPNIIAFKLFEKLRDREYRGPVRFLWSKKDRELLSIELDGKCKELIWVREE